MFRHSKTRATNYCRLRIFSYLFANKKAFLTIPSFLNGASKFIGLQAVETQTIASVQIKVENALKRVQD